MGQEDPCSVIFIPVMDTLVSLHAGETAVMVGFLQVVLHWQSHIREVIPNGFQGAVTLKSDCGQMLSFANIDNSSDFSLQMSAPAAATGKDQIILDDIFSLNLNDSASCTYSLRLYPLGVPKNDDHGPTSLPAIVIAFALACLLVTVFYQYDKYVHVRNETLIQSAAAVIPFTSITNTVCSLNGSGEGGDNASDAPLMLGPDSVKDALGKQDEDEKQVIVQDIHVIPDGFYKAGCERLKSFLEHGPTSTDSDMSKHSPPIADLFLNCSVVYADIAGFTAWSSVREPTQVFTL
jgi:hypothetical protein